MGCGVILFCIAIFCLIISAAIFEIVSAFHSEPGCTFTVASKEATHTQESTKYLVYTDKTTYEIEDSWVWHRWDSSDVYGKIKPGATYTATLQGYRIPFLSMYPNIINPVEVAK